MSAFGSRRSATPQSDSERQRKAELRSERLERARQARAATKTMEPPEPVRGIFVAAFLVLVGVVSYVGHDVADIGHVVKGKTVEVLGPVPPHPETALVLIALAIGAAVTIYWKKRLVTGIVFMLAAATGLGAPLPRSIDDGTWAAFLVPAAYVLWMLIFRMNKQQKEWISANVPGGGTAATRAGAGRNASRRSGRAGQAAASTARSKRSTPSATASATARSSVASGRYTPPRAKPRAGQRKP